MSLECGRRNHSDNELTGHGAYDLQTSRAVNLPVARYALTAPSSVNQAAFPSGTYTDGFPTTSGSQNGSYAGQLPVVATSSSDLNDVDCGNLAQYFAPGQFNPFALGQELSG